MRPHQNERAAARLRKLTAEFFSRYAERDSLLTITDLRLSKDGRRGTVMLSVWPRDAATAALAGARRAHRDLRQYLQARLRIQPLPHLNFELAEGLGENRTPV